MLLRQLRRTRKGAVSVMFAAATVPMLGLVGLAVDYGIWNEANSGLALAANVAALTAVKIAANAQLAVDTNAQTEGVNAGKQWFMAEIGLGTSTTSVVGTTPVTLTTGYPNVQVTMGATVTATVQYNATVKSIFGGILFGISKYYVSGQAQAQVTSTPYLNVELLLDNSSSMQIGATVQDQQTLMALSACDPSNYITASGSQQSADGFGNYAYSGVAGRSYDGTLSTNNGAGVYVTLNPATYSPKMTVGQNTSSNTGPSCDAVLPVTLQNQGIKAGPPCAFACHWVQNNTSGTANDELGMARRTIGTSYQVTLRFDLLKKATQSILTTMAADDEAINNLKVGIFTFNTAVKQYYPASGEAGDSWSTAESAVGLPPTTSTAQETGILPVVGLTDACQCVDNDNTAFTESMATLQSQYLTTPAGNGTVATSPRKVLIIITDGFMDDPNIAYPNDRSAFPPSACDGFKNLGYTVYVVYTPYYPVMHYSYLLMDWSVLVTGTGPTSISYNLQKCASSSSDYIAATSQDQLNAALAQFLKSALNQPARFVI